MHQDTKRYRAFVSYSQKDKRWAKRIHAALETYRVPEGIIISDSNIRLGNKRTLGRFFRDDDELAGSSSLGAALTGAIDDSENLIVICSPRAAKSKWVNDEIIRFKSRRDPNKVFAIIVDGEPNASDCGHPEQECFPLALRRVVSPDGTVTEAADEPIAPDLRKEPFKKLLARVVAGLLAVSFDALWQREQRRQRTRFLMASLIVLAIACSLGLLYYQLSTERQSAQRVDRDTRLASVKSMLGSVNAETAVEYLGKLLEENPADATVENAADTVLGWAKTPAESMEGLPGHRVFANGKNLFFKSKNGAVQLIGKSPALRRIGFKDNKLVLVLPDQVVLIDMASSRILDTFDANDGVDILNYSWDGLAFQAPDGSMLIAGRHSGISNGVLWDTLLSVSPKSNTFSLRGPREHPDAGIGPQEMETIQVASGCGTLGAGNFDNARVESYLLFKFNDGLQFFGVGKLSSAKTLAVLGKFGEDTPLSIFNKEAVESVGCSFPDFDTAILTSLAGPGGFIPAVDVASSPSASAEWQQIESTPISSAKNSVPELWGTRPTATMEQPLCSDSGDQRGTDCKIVAGSLAGDTLNLSEFDEPGWVLSSMPPAVSLEGPLVKDFDENPLFTSHVQHNAGVLSAWCRRDEKKSFQCLADFTGIEFHDNWSAIDLRSRSGQYIFYNVSKNAPVKVMDVLNLREVTPDTPPFTADIGAATFSNHADDRLFVVSNGLLRVLEPAQNSDKFSDVSTGLSWNRSIAGTEKDQAVVGLISVPPDDLILVRVDGLLRRFNWKTGVTVWEHQSPGIGNVSFAARSADGAVFVVVGSTGMRLVRSEDGLWLSGVLVPPYLLQANADLSACSDEYDSNPDRITDALSEVSIGAGPQVIARCGNQRFAWQPKPYPGDRLVRLNQLRNAARNLTE